MVLTQKGVIKINYLGIDIGKYQHTAVIINEQGQRLGKTLKFQPRQEGWDQLVEYIGNQEVKIGLEATGHYWLTLYEKFMEVGYPVVVFNPLQITSFRNKNIRGQKTDRVDAELIAHVLRFGEKSQTQLPSNQTLTLRRLARFKADLVTQIGSTKRKILAILDQVFPEYDECFENIFGKGSLAILSEYTLPEEIAKLDINELSEKLKEHSRGRFGAKEANELKDKAKKSFGVKFGLDAFELQVKILVEQIKHLEGQAEKVGQEIKGIIGEHILLSIPGISYTTAGLILGELGDIQRFVGTEAVKQITAIAGLDPQLKESGEWQGKVKMSKRGSKYLRRAIMQASFVAYQYDPMFKQVYEKQKSKGKHHFVALSHVARKMIAVIYAVLRDQKKYEPVL